MVNKIPDKNHPIMSPDEVERIKQYLILKLGG